ncbi:hypothetical protein Tco_1173257 [Tanacetum coccineum]
MPRQWVLLYACEYVTRPDVAFAQKHNKPISTESRVPKQSISLFKLHKLSIFAAFDASKEDPIAIANESGITKGARHFRAKVHYLREVIEFGDIKLEKVHTDDNLADPFTKALAFPKHSELTRNIGMLPASSFM